ncbi:hypothetical protein VZ94_09850 [Methylocucumis oryzae]|uniref:Lysozyme inhibitor LprI-like N-terminal domain-containing protein n=1 Tax=Methylocucumis oryzae TaxID=1632867 RepID=A0A0F3IIQ4_9GAMM|nr:hypothetical protein VZ94_09850 [Methylocucumis oryzae]
MILSTYSYSPVWSQSNLECNYSGTQSQMNVCAEREFLTSDLELNQIYNELISCLIEKKFKTLLTEQRTWLRARDSKCKKLANNEAKGGSMWPMLFNSCRATSTKARIEQLKKWKKQPA